MKLRKIIAGLALLLIAFSQLCLPALAATGVAGRVQITNSTKAAYRTCSAFTAPAASTTDFAEIYGSSSKTVFVKRITVIMAANVNGSTINPVFVVRRSTANSGGTATTETAVKNDTNSGSATATVKTYTANPTTGTLVGRIASNALGLGISPTMNSNAQAIVLYEARPDTQAETLRGTGEGLCVNFNGTKPDVGTPTLSVCFEWEEE